ncbi:N-acetyl-D-muramate 6-phosphate phosphatase [Burkholderiales bacterium]|nr:N-acetyl-D-muramate 6-phosphate phosphatase [Burkholderiales bacterium]
MTASGRLDVGAVLFDLDGTLADTAGDLAGALNRVRADQGQPPMPVESLRRHASSGARGLLAAGMGLVPGGEGYESAREAFLRHYAACLVDTTRLFDGVEEMLAGIEARGLAWGIVTNKAERYTGPVVVALGLADRAGTIVSGDTTPHPKPHPAPLLHAASALRLPPSHCVYVGDDRRDIDAGNSAGMPTLVAHWGYLGNGDPPSSWPARGWLDTPRDLAAWLPA